MDAITADYCEQGFVVIPSAIPENWIDGLMDAYMRLVRRISRRPFEDPNGADLIEYFDRNRDVESKIYREIRNGSLLQNFAMHDSIVAPVKQLLAGEAGLLRKIPFRIDMPRWTEELAHWHQDYFYVKGNESVVTAWIPMQDTTFLNGCLSIMPGTHLHGAIAHDLVVGKKRVPRRIFHNQIRMVEMQKGDLLLFNALTLHSGNLNLSNTIRYSVQPRFSLLNARVDEAMGGLLAA